jgi:hypothetical protein
MAVNGAYICDIKSEQTIEGKKTFAKEIVAPAFVLQDGTELLNTAVTQIENNVAHRVLLATGNSTIKTSPAVVLRQQTLIIDGTLKAVEVRGKLIGDGSDVQNISFDNIDGDLPLGRLNKGPGLKLDNNTLGLEIGAQSGLFLDREGLRVDASTIERNRGAHDNDMVIVHQPNSPHRISKVTVKNLFSLISGHNGRLFDFVNTGRNVGTGASVYQNVTVAPGTVSLNFRTLLAGPNLDIIERPNELVIDLNENIAVEVLDVSDALVLPRVSKDAIENPVNGMLIYNTDEERFYGYARNKWVALSPRARERV